MPETAQKYIPPPLQITGPLSGVTIGAIPDGQGGVKLLTLPWHVYLNWPVPPGPPPLEDVVAMCMPFLATPSFNDESLAALQETLKPMGIRVTRERADKDAETRMLSVGGDNATKVPDGFGVYAICFRRAGGSTICFNMPALLRK